MIELDRFNGSGSPARQFSIICKLAMMRKGFSTIAVSLLTACQSVPKEPAASRSQEEGYFSKARTAPWVRSEGLVEGTAEEVAAARATEVRIEKQKAMLPDLGLEVFFTMGTMHPVSGTSHFGPQTTTSFYALRNSRTGTIEARIPSSLSSTMNSELRYKQKIWVAQDARSILIFDTWGDGSSSHDMYALVSAGSDKQTWDVKYLSVPRYSPFQVESGAVPVGFAGDVLLFDPGVSGKIYKKRLSELEVNPPPLPFTMG